MGALLVFAILVPHAIKFAYYPSYPGFDDAFIHLKIAENLALGKGWGINAFEPINVSSSPVFTLILAAAFRLAGWSIGFGMLFSAVAASAAIAIAWFAGRRWTDDTWRALLPAMFFAINVHLWRWNATVMEATLASVGVGLATLSFWWAGSGPPIRFAAFGAIVGVSFLTRFELGLLLPAAAVALLIPADGAARDFRRIRQALLWTATGVLPVVLIWFAYCWSTFGTPLPTTFLSKAASVSLLNVTTVRSIVLVLGSALGVAALLTLAALGGVVRQGGWPAVVRATGPFVLPLTFSVFCVAFYAIAVREFQSAARYLLPVMFALSVVAGGVVAGAVARGAAPVVRSLLLPALVVQLLLMMMLNHVTVAPVLRGFKDNYWRASQEVAEYLANAARPGDSVFAASDIGILAYYGRDRYRLVDAPGLSAPTMVGRSAGEILQRSSPRFVVEHYGETESEHFGEEFVRVKAVPFAAAGLISSSDTYSLNVYERRGQPAAETSR